MIRYLDGILIAKSDKAIVVLVNGIGYEVELPVTVWRTYATKTEGSNVKLYISYQQSQNQPVPRLYGFECELERDFFEELLRVNDVGPSVALSVMSAPVRQTARAIVDRDVKTLKSVKGVGEKLGDKIVAELRNRVAKYALLPEDSAAAAAEPSDFRFEVRETLVKQLHFKPAEAQRAIEEALKRDKTIASAEELFDEVLRGSK